MDDIQISNSSKFFDKSIADTRRIAIEQRIQLQQRLIVILCDSCQKINRRC